MDILDGLNPQQLQAVTTTEGRNSESNLFHFAYLNPLKAHARRHPTTTKSKHLEPTSTPSENEVLKSSTARESFTEYPGKA